MLTTAPAAMVFDLVKSTLRNVTVPVAVLSTRRPWVWNVFETSTGTSSRSAGTTPASASVAVASGSARTVSEDGGIGPWA